MTRPVTSTTLRQNLFRRYENKSFLPVYKKVCGDQDSYLDSDVRTKFNGFLVDILDKNPAPYRDALSPRNPNSSEAAKGIFEKFLKNGDNCSERSPARHAITFANSIAGAPDELAKYSIWRTFFNKFALYVERFKPLVTGALERNTKRMRADINALTDEYEPYVDQVDDKIEKLLSNMTMPLRFVVWAHLTAIREMRTLMLPLNTSSYDQRTIDDSFFMQLCESFLNAWEDFTDPFLWVKKRYEKMEEWEKPIDISVAGEHPLLKPEKPHTLKDAVDQIVFIAAMIGTNAGQTKLEFSWDEALEVMIVFSNSLGLIKKHPLWPSTEDMIRELGGRLEETDLSSGRIIIPIRVAISASSHSGGAALPDTGELPSPGESGESQTISGFVPALNMPQHKAYAPPFAIPAPPVLQAGFTTMVPGTPGFITPYCIANAAFL